MFIFKIFKHKLHEFAQILLISKIEVSRIYDYYEFVKFFIIYFSCKFVQFVSPNKELILSIILSTEMVRMASSYPFTILFP